nr:unnamed protein product [Callosobruchus chinensis]
MRNTLLCALRAIPVCRAAAYILAARMQKAESVNISTKTYLSAYMKNMVELHAAKTQYCTLSNKRCPSEHSVLMNNQALPTSRSFKLSGVNIIENMIWHEQVSSTATAAGKKYIYSELGSTSHHTTVSRFVKPI